MGLLDRIKYEMKAIRQSVTGETDIVCPKCKQAKMRITDSVIDTMLLCPKCFFSLNNNLNGNGGNPPCPPTPMEIKYD